MIKWCVTCLGQSSTLGKTPLNQKLRRGCGAKCNGWTTPPPRLGKCYFLVMLSFLLVRFLLPFLIHLVFRPYRDLVQAKRRRLRKVAEVWGAATSAAGESAGLQASETTEGPVGRSVEEDTRPVEGGSTGQERRGPRGLWRRRRRPPLLPWQGHARRGR